MLFGNINRGLLYYFNEGFGYFPVLNYVLQLIPYKIEKNQS